ncbi:MAG: peptidase [Variovorax sp.]|nr:peptidase [Variovorax sp.]
MSIAATITAAQAEADTQHWLECAVIGLNLCPFAKAVHAKRQIRYAVHAAATDDAGLMEALMREATDLARCSPSERDTTLLIAPNTLADFLDFNDFTRRAERRLVRAGFGGELQLASFHPRFEFAGSASDDIANATNRAPYPTLHLLREDSVGRAVDAFPEADAIFERNIETLKTLGVAGWAALDVGPGGARR